MSISHAIVSRQLKHMQSKVVDGKDDVTDIDASAVIVLNFNMATACASI